MVRVTLSCNLRERASLMDEIMRFLIFKMTQQGINTGANFNWKLFKEILNINFHIEETHAKYILHYWDPTNWSNIETTGVNVPGTHWE